MIRLTIGTNTEKTSVIVQPTDTLADVFLLKTQVLGVPVVAQ